MLKLSPTFIKWKKHLEKKKHLNITADYSFTDIRCFLKFSWILRFMYSQNNRPIRNILQWDKLFLPMNRIYRHHILGEVQHVAGQRVRFLRDLAQGWRGNSRTSGLSRVGCARNVVEALHNADRQVGGLSRRAQGRCYRVPWYFGCQSLKSIKNEFKNANFSYH